MREAFSQSLLKAASSNPKVVVLTGDHGYALFDSFQKEYPERFINCGIAEQNMLGVAAGLAKSGFLPIVYGLAAFIPIRVLEQYKMDICYENLHVILIGDGAGMVYSHLGSSHQSTEDIAALRAIPNTQIYSPADAFELTACMNLALENKAPTYIRIGKSDTGLIHETNINLKAGELIPIICSPQQQKNISFIATGSMVKTASSLSLHFQGSHVWSAPIIKPINEQQVLRIANQSHTIVTLEEHNTHAGLGSLISEITSAHPTHRPRVIRIGINDRFSEKCGSYSYLIKEHLLNEEALLMKLKSLEI